MTETDVVRLTKQTMDLRSFGTATVLVFVTTPLFVGLFRFVADSGTEWSLLAAYAILFLWGLVDILLMVLFAWGSVDFLPWPKRKGPEIARTGWQVSDLPQQVFTGLALFGLPILVLWLVFRPGLKTDDLGGNAVLIVLQWTVVAPIETWLASWTWPMIMPFGPFSAAVAAVLLHGERAMDPAFAVAAFFLFLAFWGVSFARYYYAGSRGARWFGPIAAWSGHATWNSLLIFVALSFPVV